MAVKQRFENIIKSEEDKRLYRCLVLDNNMRVCLVSDETTDKSAACMDISVGYLSDPAELPGLAHFCEHMLFLGTKKYPNENEYNKFLSQHSGHSNAHTSTDHTDYYFDVAPEHLRKVLDMFAQFFIEPLFTESMTDREVKAIESENSKNLLSDLWRVNHLEKSTCKPNHDYGKFGTGNRETLIDKPKELGINLRDELLKFYNKWYSANAMSLTIIGKESLDELENMAVEYFSPVKCSDIEIPFWSDPPYGPDQLKKRIYCVPVKDTRQLHILFPTADFTSYYKCNPSSYVSHVIGHEGPGSILSALRSRGWCNGLVAGSRSECRGVGSFMIKVDLTEEGMLHIDDIISLIYQYIEMLRELGPKVHIFEEMRDLNQINFRFKDKELPMSLAVQLSYNLRMFDLEDVLSGPFLCNEWRPDLIVKELMDKLIPDNMRATVLAQKFKSEQNLKEKWYGTEYTIEPIPEETLETWRNPGVCPELQLPPPNDFIPSDFSLLPLEADVKPYPIIIHDTMTSRVWYKQDDKFLLPKASIRIELTSPRAYMDPVSSNKSVLFVQLFDDALKEYSYAALLAGLVYKLIVTSNGLQFYVEGYNDKQSVLLKKVMEKMVDMKFSEQRFKILKEMYVRSLRNFELEQPHQHALYFMTVLMTEKIWTKEDLLDTIDDITLEQVEAFIPQLLSNLHLVFLVHGNISREGALDIAKIVEDSIKSKVNICPLQPKQLVHPRQVQLEDRCNYLYRLPTSVHPSSCTLMYLQCGNLNTENNMKLELLTQIVAEPAFNILRTKEQLGYIVLCSNRCSNTEQGLRLVVQSSHNSSYVEKRVEAFLEHMGGVLRNMSEKEFEKHREALAVRRLMKPKKLAALTNRFWEEIESQQYHFDRDNVEVAYLHTLTKSDMIDYYEECINHAAPKRKKLIVLVVPTNDPTKLLYSVEEAEKDPEVPEDLFPVPDMTAPQVEIENPLDFQNSHPLCPYAKAYMNIPFLSIGARSKL